MIKRIYNTKIELKGEQAYYEVSHYLSGICSGIDYSSTKNYFFYFLDADKTQVARFNEKKKTVELTDKVKQDIIDSINYIKRQEEIR
jgi:hypothetical protein